MQKIIPFLWFDNQAEEAAKFYTSVFKNSKTKSASYYEEETEKVSGKPKGSVMTVPFELGGQPFVALNGGPQFKFTEAISFLVNCDTQKEVDYFWEKLSDGGDPKAQQCGWLKDKFGVSWQIVPTMLGEILGNPATSQNVMKEFLQMKKIDIAVLRRAQNRKEKV
jgi:predicted 3-demethylubiquinone-9 3-methyltransferase (glyoxalase superfamily)